MAIKLAATGVAEFVSATPARRRSILRPYKNKKSGETAGRGNYYQKALNAIRRFHKNNNDAGIINDTIAALKLTKEFCLHDCTYETPIEQKSAMWPILAAPTRTPTTHTPVAAPIPRHDRPTHVARRCVAQVDKLFQRVGRVIQATIYDRGAFGHWLLALGQSTLRRCRFSRLAEC